MLFHLLIPFSIYSDIMAVALIPDKAFLIKFLVRIGAHFMENRKEGIRWHWHYGLLATQMVCSTLNCYHGEEASKSAIDGVTWRWPVKACKKRISIIHGSFFEKLHLKLWQILGFTFLWCRSAGKSRGMSMGNAQHELEIWSEHSIVN